MNKKQKCELFKCIINKEIDIRNFNNQVEVRDWIAGSINNPNPTQGQVSKWINGRNLPSKRMEEKILSAIDSKEPDFLESWEKVFGKSEQDKEVIVGERSGDDVFQDGNKKYLYITLISFVSLVFFVLSPFLVSVVEVGIKQYINRKSIFLKSVVFFDKTKIGIVVESRSKNSVRIERINISSDYDESSFKRCDKKIFEKEVFLEKVQFEYKSSNESYLIFDEVGKWVIPTSQKEISISITPLNETHNPIIHSNKSDQFFVVDLKNSMYADCAADIFSDKKVSLQYNDNGDVFDAKI